MMISKGKGDGGSQSLERGQYSANSDPCGGVGVGGLAGAPPGGQPGSSCPWQHCWESDICMYLVLGALVSLSINGRGWKLFLWVLTTYSSIPLYFCLVFCFVFLLGALLSPVTGAGTRRGVGDRSVPVLEERF